MAQQPILPVPGMFQPRQAQYAQGRIYGPTLSIDQITDTMNILIGRLTNKYYGENNREKELIYDLYCILESKMVYNQAMRIGNQYKQDIEDIKRMYAEAGPDEFDQTGYGINFREAELLPLQDIIGSCEVGVDVAKERVEWRVNQASPSIKELYDVLIKLEPKDGLKAKPFNFNEEKDTVIRKLMSLLMLDTATARSLAHDADKNALDRYIAKRKGWGGSGSYAKGGKRRNKKKATRKTRRHRLSR